ncbi:enoyl-CoA hydratase/isomerase family protein [Conexibacter sp. S30A1]|uniref:enoyl-CoA hydratase/isomerase family protein n=1 Tax=Conexibacter sp. S30A1 TaxID=2937800 RepID=UPI00200E9EE3|nr:enoyl-CoA hydratase/isomerase family protein [Conexibacter sp. S30A1]
MTEDVSTEVDGNVAIVEIHRGPNNFFDEELLGQIAKSVLALDERSDVRSVVLCSEGRHFCAGADLRDATADSIRRMYRHAFALFTARRPIVAAVQGSAVGGGLGLALAADFRVARPDSRFTANFARIGFHQGFGLSVTLPWVVGSQTAKNLLYTGRAVAGTEAAELGLCDRVTEGDVRDAALELATEIAGSAPLSLVAIRATMRRRLVAEVSAALDLEADAQTALLGTKDFAEGVSASIARRDPIFTGT